MFFSALLLNLLLAVAAFALPTAKERFDARTARRSRGSSQPKITNATHIDYSSNWAGSVINAGAGTWQIVEGTFTVPVPSSPNGQPAAASAWVGIDGDTCGNAILQTGLDFVIDYGAVSYDAWFEWYPDYAYDFTGITFSPGDSVTLIVQAASTTLGYAFVINNSNGQEVGVEIESPYALCEQDAEWIVEDFEENGGLVPFADFGTVTFTSAVATTNAGQQVGAGSGTVFDIYQSSQLTSVSTSGSSVTISYI